MLSPRKIAMVGTAASRLKAPFADESYEIWGVGGRGSEPRATRWYELHSLRAEPDEWVAAWCKQLREVVTRDCDLYMIYPRADCGPRVKQFPTERILARFGSFHLTSSFSWMMAQAIDELVPVGNAAPPGSLIEIWGVDMEYGTEYAQQRAGFRAFISIAHALGITVLRPAESGLSYDPVPYPMWQDDPMLSKVSLIIGRIKRAMAGKDDDLRKIRSMIAQNRAVTDELQRWIATGSVPAGLNDRVAVLAKETETLLQSSANISREIALLEGQSEAYHHWRDYIQP